MNEYIRNRKYITNALDWVFQPHSTHTTPKIDLSINPSCPSRSYNWPCSVRLFHQKSVCIPYFASYLHTQSIMVPFLLSSSLSLSLYIYIYVYATVEILMKSKF
jgi:hypothetical protein